MDRRSGFTAFCMAVVPEAWQSTGHYIWFTLVGVDPGEGCGQKALAFSKGGLADNSVRLHEFALYYTSAPRDKAERFTVRGVGLEVP